MAEGELSLSSTQMRDLPRSPTIISPSSSRKGSLRSSNNTEKESAPSPPLTRLMKKRAASLDTDAANNPSIANLSLHSASFESPRTDSNNQVCLCQPDPKIPRPRNGTYELSPLFSHVCRLWVKCSMLLCFVCMFDWALIANYSLKLLFSIVNTIKGKLLHKIQGLPTRRYQRSSGHSGESNLLKLKTNGKD